MTEKDHPAPGDTLTVQDIADLIDHALLRPEMTPEEVVAQATAVAPSRVWSLCVRPADLVLVASVVTATPPRIGTVIGFPHGSTSTQAKVAEAQQAIADGAAELDMVLNIGLLRGGHHDQVRDDIAAVVQTAHRVHVPVKVILETALLDDAMKVAGCRAAVEAGADFVKTSTGFAGGGATLHDVALLRACVPESVGVKASGGIRDLDTLLAMVAAGATRIGTSSTGMLLDEARERAAAGTLVLPVAPDSAFPDTAPGY